MFGAAFLAATGYAFEHKTNQMAAAHEILAEIEATTSHVVTVAMGGLPACEIALDCTADQYVHRDSI